MFNAANGARTRERKREHDHQSSAHAAMRLRCNSLGRGPLFLLSPPCTTGGIIYLDRQAFLVMESSLLASGGAVSSGGGIYASPGAMVALISTQLTGCSAKLGNGGAVYLGQKAR